MADRKRSSPEYNTSDDSEGSGSPSKRQNTGSVTPVSPVLSTEPAVPVPPGEKYLPGGYAFNSWPKGYFFEPEKKKRKTLEFWMEKVLPYISAVKANGERVWFMERIEAGTYSYNPKGIRVDTGDLGALIRGLCKRPGQMIVVKSFVYKDPGKYGSNPSVRDMHPNLTGDWTSIRVEGKPLCQVYFSECEGLNRRSERGERLRAEMRKKRKTKGYGPTVKIHMTPQGWCVIPKYYGYTFSAGVLKNANKLSDVVTVETRKPDPYTYEVMADLLKKMTPLELMHVASENPTLRMVAQRTHFKVPGMPQNKDGRVPYLTDMKKGDILFSNYLKVGKIMTVGLVCNIKVVYKGLEIKKEDMPAAFRYMLTIPGTTIGMNGDVIEELPGHISEQLNDMGLDDDRMFTKRYLAIKSGSYSVPKNPKTRNYHGGMKFDTDCDVVVKKVKDAPDTVFLEFRFL